MSENLEHIEQKIQQMARNLPYPSTPRLVTRRSSRRVAFGQLRYAAVVLVLLSVVLMTTPPIRATLRDALQLGAATVYLDGHDSAGERLQLADIQGETTLAASQTAVDITLLVAPDAPPDRVYLQNERLVIFVWLDGRQIETVLYQADDVDWQVVKSTEDVISTRVGEATALWLPMPHPVQIINGDETAEALTTFVDDHVLLWSDGGVTYRLETRMALEDARQFAESLVPYTPTVSQ